LWLLLSNLWVFFFTNSCCFSLGFQLSVKGDKLPPESIVGVDKPSLFFDMLQCFIVGHTMFLH
jgi:hypothetical protein